MKSSQRLPALNTPKPTSGYRAFMIHTARVLPLLTATLLISCGGSGGDNVNVLSDPQLDDPRIVPSSEVRPFISDGPFADVLADCAYADETVDYEREGICTLATLPYIGQTTDTITVDDILERTLVTHDWMGMRLRDLLSAMPADLLPMFAPVTSVVIGSEVRPSSFNWALGRMKIDAAHLWTTVPEKRTISQEDDFRSNFGADLQFVSFWRLMNGDEYAIPRSSLSDDNPREFNDTVLQAARPLFHELAHANDVIRPENIAGFSSDLTPLQATELFREQRISNELYADESLSVPNSFLYSLARVRYADETPDEFQKSYLADFVGGEMGNEGKQTFYGYFTIYEDMATLFAQTMMKYHFDIETHVAFLNKPANQPDPSCNDYKVAWGVRNRLAAPLVAPRARFVTEKLIGSSTALDTFFAESLGTQVPLREGDGWCDSRFLTPAVSTARSRLAAEEQLQFEYQRRLFADRPH
ncbi:MAG: hypothetical protein AB8B97_19380 [Granulosicoccus sp.]